MDKVHQTENCNQSEMETNLKSNLTHHIETNHILGIYLLCNICKYTGKTQAHLRNHKDKDHGENRTDQNKNIKIDETINELNEDKNSEPEVDLIQRETKDDVPTILEKESPVKNDDKFITSNSANRGNNVKSKTNENTGETSKNMLLKRNL